jgi:hypothetical protein
MGWTARYALGYAPSARLMSAISPCAASREHGQCWVEDTSERLELYALICAL